jgi:hypothetical protein
MRKAIFNLKVIINSRNRFYLLLFLLPLFFQSCSTEEFVQASSDVQRQEVSGPSYTQSSSDAGDIGFNLALLVLYGGTIATGSNPYNDYTIKGSGLEQFGNLYASNSHGPSIPYTDSLNREETAKLPKENVSPRFVSHLRGMAGIEFVQKNSKDGDTKITLNYLQVPLYALYYYQLPSKGSIFGGLGPYFAYGIGGKMKSTFNGQTTETKSFDKTTGFKPFDAGLSITAGYKIPNSFSFSLAYEIGLVNIDRNAFGDETKNRGISLNISYPLNKIIKK